jgi:uncharacterized membrane protein
MDTLDDTDYDDDDEFDQSDTISVGDWMVTYLIAAVPLLGFIMLWVWAFGSTTPPSKANWAKATLLFYVVAALLGAVFVGMTMLAKPATQQITIGRSYRVVK